MESLVRIIGRANLVLGKIAAPITLVITGLVLMEVFLRYFFNAPTTWSNEMVQYLLCALVMFGGGFTLRNYGHTRVDIVHVRFSARARAWVEVATGVFVVAVTLPMMWFGGILTWEAILSGQTSVSAAQLPLWPSMATVPLGAFFLALQGVANGLEAARSLATGRGLGEEGGRS